jgi:hypothetical protein
MPERLQVGWHVARAEDRASIGRHGLLPAEPFVGNSHGVYLWTTGLAEALRIAADAAAEDALDGRPRDYDVWQADLDGVPVYTDTLFSGAVYAPVSLGPERLTRRPAGLSEPDRSYYLQEACASLALALQTLTGWQLAILWGNGSLDDWGSGPEPTPAHVFCLDPDGRAVDAEGARSLGELKAAFADDLVDPSIDQQASRAEVEALMGDGRPLCAYDPDAEDAADALLRLLLAS